MDSTILPHYLHAASVRSGSSGSEQLTNVGLLVGEVINSIYPDDERNTTDAPKQMQYIVRCQQRSAAGMLINVDYACTVANVFGGQGDVLRYTLRPSSGQKKQQGLTDGHRVLVMCPNGQSSNAVILTGINHHLGDPDDGKDSGHHLEFEFNGVNVEIDKDGQLVLVVPGATKIDGSAADGRDSHNQGTEIRLLKDGTVQIDNNQGELIEVNSTDRKINLKSKNETHSTEESWTLTATKDVKVAAGGKVDIAADANARFDAGGSVYIGAEGCSENLVLGRQLQSALADLVASVITPNVATWGQLAAIPVQMHPNVAAAFAQWLAKWVAGPLPPILSKDKFTE